MLSRNIIILSIAGVILQSCGSFADDATKLSKCDSALSACVQYTKDLNDEVDVLNLELVTIKEQRDEAVSEAAKENTTLLSPWVWIVGGAVIGGLVTHELSH